VQDAHSYAIVGLRPSSQNSGGAPSTFPKERVLVCHSRTIYLIDEFHNDIISNKMVHGVNICYGFQTGTRCHVLVWRKLKGG
jgi:hypothetical protein